MNRVRDPIDRHLETLEPERASDGFTERVMESIGSSLGDRRSPRSLRAAWAVAAAALVAVLVLMIRAQPNHLESAQNRAHRLTEMRRQHAALERELAALQASARDAAPVIYLGSVDEVDYVWDLSPLLERQAGRAVHATSRRAGSPELTKESP